MTVVNQQFGKYHLRERIASGGMAEIFLGRLEGAAGFSKTLVIKRILPHFSRDREFVSMLVDEACLAAGLIHPNVVQIYDFGSIDDVYFIAMEYVDGVDLRTLQSHLARRGESLGPAEVAKIGEGIAAGLHFAHTTTDEGGRPLEIIHRDVSPHNILLSRSGEVKIADFGIARARDRATHTATGAIKGKVAYMAPEQVRAEEFDARVDQFALGVVLWECLTGERLFGEGSGIAVMQRAVECDIPKLSARVDGTPPELGRIVDRMLSREVADRFSDMNEVATALGAFQFSLGAEGRVHLGSRVLGVKPATSEEESDHGTLALDRAEEVSAAPSLEASERETDLLASEAAKWGTAPLPTLSWNPDAQEVEEGTRVVTPRWRSLFFGALVALVMGGAGVWFAVAPSEPVLESPVPRGDLAGEAAEAPSKPLGGEPEKEKAGAPKPTFESRRPGVIGAAPKRAKSAPRSRRPGVIGAAPKRAVLGPEKGASRVLSKSAAPKFAPGASATGGDDRPKKRPPVTAPVPTGKLSLRAHGPWAAVYWQGKLLGRTPLIRLDIPAGDHVLEMKNPALGLEKTVGIKVKEGELTLLSVDTNVK